MKTIIIRPLTSELSSEILVDFFTSICYNFQVEKSHIYKEKFYEMI